MAGIFHLINQGFINKMLNFIAIIKTLIAILPILKDLITAAEGFFPAQGSGVQKLELVKTMLQSAYDAVGKIETPFSAIWPVLQSIITYVVPMFTRTSSATLTDTTAAQVASLAHVMTATTVVGRVASPPVSLPQVGAQLATPDA